MTGHRGMCLYSALKFETGELFIQEFVAVLKSVKVKCQCKKQKTTKEKPKAYPL